MIDVRCPECNEIVCKQATDGLLYTIQSKGRHGKKKEYIIIRVYCCNILVAEDTRYHISSEWELNNHSIVIRKTI